MSKVIGYLEDSPFNDDSFVKEWFREWGKSKDKKYWWIQWSDGRRTIKYMPIEQVHFLRTNRDIKFWPVGGPELQVGDIVYVEFAERTYGHAVVKRVDVDFMEIQWQWCSAVHPTAIQLDPEDRIGTEIIRWEMLNEFEVCQMYLVERK